MKKTFISLLSIFLIVYSVSCNKIETAPILNGITQLESQNDSLLQLVIQLQTSLDSVQNRVNQNTTLLNTINTNVTGLQSSVATLIINITLLKSKIDTANSNISSIQQQVTTLVKQYNSLSSQISNVFSSLSNQIDSLSTQTAFNTALLNTLQTDYLTTQIKVDSILLQIQRNNQLLTTNNTNISQIQTQLIALTTEYNTVIILLNQLIALINPQSSLANGLVAYFPFTGNAKDSSGNSNNGAVYGATLTTDRFGNANHAYSFNGTTNYIEIPYSSLYDNPNYSFSFWVLSLISTNNQGGPQVNQGVIARNAVGGPFSTPASADNWVIFEDGGIIAFGGAGNAGTPVTGPEGETFTGVTGSWHHIVFTNSNMIMNTYLDGNLTQTVSYSTPISYKNQVTRIGLSLNTYWKAFLGSVDEFRIYNRVLTQSEITYLATH